MKFYAKYILFTVIPASIICSEVSAQQSLSCVAKDNFTFFTETKTYDNIAKLTALTPLQYRNNPDFGIRLNDSANWYERIDKRTLKTRTYKGPGNEIIFEKGYDNLNYVDANGWMRAVNTKLKPADNGWSAVQQEIPVYLYHDAVTALSLGGNDLMTFNKNVKFNNQGISINNYMVGDNGMYIKNAAPNTDKIIRFGRGRVETDYRINQPIKLNGDLIISEDITLPDGYAMSENTNYDPEIDWPGSLIVTNASGKTVAEIKSPLCYDNHGSIVFGSYNFQKQSGGYHLEVDVPSSWINNSLRQFPVTIDPVVNGPITVYSGGIIPSCIYPQFDTASIVDTIPAKVTVTHFYAQGEYYTPALPLKYGFVSLQTSCLSTPITYAGNTLPPDSANMPGWAWLPLLQNDIFPNGATCCYGPSCSVQTFRLIMGVSRDTMDTLGCNALYYYYDPSNTLGEPFEAFIVGLTVQSASFTIPTSTCANQCTLSLSDSIFYGVPPYTITHPWMSDIDTTGSYSTNNCTSEAAINLTLTIPDCPRSCFATSLKVPPPLIIDACGDTVKGLDSESVSLMAVPDVVATPANQTVVSGTPISISLSSCVAGTSYTWSDSSGKNGSGTPITDTPVDNGSTNKLINFTVTPTAGGCTGDAAEFSITVLPPCETVHIPSAFTPDKEENNYLHVLHYGDVTLQEFKVYNRWGQAVFETSDINDKWDGTFNGKPEPLGTYVYYAIVNCDGSSMTLKGNVTLIR